MHFHTWRITALLCCVGLVVSSKSPSIRTVYEFTTPSHAENIAVRENGQLLVTLFDVPTIYQINPVGPPKPQAIYTFPRVLGLFGIAEVRKDVFAVVAGNISLATLLTEPRSFSVWQVDLRSTSKRPTVSKIADFPDAVFLNGLVSRGNGVDVLIADAGLGVVFRLNTLTGKYKIVINDPLMKPIVGGPIFLGINGVQILRNTLYFTNTDQLLIAKVPIHSNGTASGSAQIIAHSGVSDDFALGPLGTTYIAVQNTITIVTPAGKVTALNATGGIGSANTSPKFGRTSVDKNVLYVTGYTPVGNQTVGRVLAVSLE